MPQVAFNVDKFCGEVVKPEQELVATACEAMPDMVARKVANRYTAYRIPGFWEAYRAGFRGWHLHHILGESVPKLHDSDSGLYYAQPWWALRFMKVGDHRALHQSEDFKDAYYGI